MCLCHHCNQSIHVTEVTTVTTLFAGLQHKTHAVTFCLCQIALKPNSIMCLCQIGLNWTVSCKFKKWCRMLSHIKAKSCKRRLRKRDLPVFTILVVMTLTSDMVRCNRSCGFLDFYEEMHSHMWTHTENTPENSFIYLGNKEWYCIFKTSCIISCSFFFSQHAIYFIISSCHFQ